MNIIMMRWLAGFGTLLLLLLSSYLYGRHAEHLLNEAEKVKAIEETNAIISAYNKRIIDAETQHDKDTITVNNARIALNRLPVPIKTCSTTTAASTNTNGTSGVAATGDDEAMARFKQGMDEIGNRCADLNIDAIRYNNSIK